MKRILMAAVLALGVGAFGEARAADDSMKQHSKSKESASSMSGQKQGQLTIREVDQDSQKITFEATVKPQTKITEQGGKSLQFGDLKEGDQVRASFDSKGDITKLEKVSPSGSSGSMGSDPQQQPKNY